MGASQVALVTSEQATDLIAWYGLRGYRHVQEVDWKVTNYRSVVLSKPLELPTSSCARQARPMPASWPEGSEYGSSRRGRATARNFGVVRQEARPTGAGFT